jgi:hypothetical protein
MLPFSLIVHAYSNVSLQAHLLQSSFEPGTTVGLNATLAQSGVPVTDGAYVWAVVTRPDKTTTTVVLNPANEGQFAAPFTTTTAGIYQFRVRARGTTPRGEVFSRERTLTAGVWAGGDQDANRGGQTIVDYLRGRDQRLCELLHCLSQPDGAISRKLEEELRALGVDLEKARKCLAILCSGLREDPKLDQ